MRILTIDQGTTNTKALVMDQTGAILARAGLPTATHYPRPGWAEQSAAEIWTATQSVINTVATQVGANSIDAIAISNQRETLVFWDARSGAPVAPAILWQCRRTADDCARLIAEGQNDLVESLTGLGINPLFPASKLAWMLRHDPQVADLRAAGHLRAGTVDSWLLWNLSGGASFATDHSNASRTQLFDTERLSWSDDLAKLFGTDTGCLPVAMPSDSRFGETAKGTTVLPAGIPIHAMMGDSHAALYGHGIRSPGTVKATYGTGSSLMTLTPERTQSQHGLSATIAWTDKHGPTYALEGNITVSAQAAAFMAQILGLTDARALSDLAQSVVSSHGVAFVPALAGLGAPHWHNDARGTLVGMTHGTTPAHIARATFEAIACQIADVFNAMQSDIGAPLQTLRADGGASSNAFLMQLQADLLARTVHVSDIEEVGAIGAAAMAFEAFDRPLQLVTGQRSYAASGRDMSSVHAVWRRALRQSMTA